MKSRGNPMLVANGDIFVPDRNEFYVTRILVQAQSRSDAFNTSLYPSPARFRLPLLDPGPSRLSTTPPLL